MVGGTDFYDSEYIPLSGCVTRGIYRLLSRNLAVGVYDGDGGFIGIRTKFGERYLFTEHHWDQGAPFGTVRPLGLLGALDENVELRETNDPVCGIEGCGRPVTFTQIEEGAFGRRMWAHTDDSTPICESGSPTTHIYTPLFEALEQFADTEQLNPGKFDAGEQVT